jgi:hypothetical protein
MTTDIVTLCHSALLTSDQTLSVLGAFDAIIAPTLPHKFPPFAVAVRVRFSSEESGDHKLMVTVLDIDGRVLGEALVGIRLSPESFHPTATLSIALPISGMLLKSYGEHAIDLALDEQSLVRSPFYVRPPS